MEMDIDEFFFYIHKETSWMQIPFSCCA